jgi:diguanylate cyclase (GGDEF)-like protein
MRWWSLVGRLVGAVLLLVVVVSSVISDRASVLASERAALAQQAAVESQMIDGYFNRANALIDLTARNPAFQDYYSLPGDQARRTLSTGLTMNRVIDALIYLGRMYPDKTGRASFIDVGGAENVRVVSGQAISPSELGSDKGNVDYFKPTFALPQGVVYQSRPYLSKELNDWVISSATQVLTPDRVKHAMVQFAVPLQSIGQLSKDTAYGRFLVVDADTGEVVINMSEPGLGRSGSAPDRRFGSLAPGWGESGALTLDGRQAAYHQVPAEVGNANHWYAVAVATKPVTILNSIGWLPITVALVALLLVVYLTAALRRTQSALVSAADTDPLTRLHNRRRLATDLGFLVPRATADQPLLLILSDLNGFKAYNDTFGHPAGDQLLTQLASSLALAVGDQGKAYRIGGDEFCVLARPGRAGIDALIAAVSRALSDEKRSMLVTASHGAIILPDETADSHEAMILVDRRMYQQKHTHYRRAGDAPPPVSPPGPGPSLPARTPGV